MIQQQNLKLRCQQDGHQDEINTVCYYQFCQEFRLTCFKCIKKGLHHSHINNIEKISSIAEFIDKQNQEYNLNTQVESVNDSFSQLKSGIKNKYSLVKERLVHLNSQQINDFLNSITKFGEYKQSIKSIISEQIKKLSNSFNNLCQQLQLSSINYYQIDDKHIKLSKELYEQGYQLYFNSKFDQAIEIFDKSIESDLNNHLSLWCKGAFTWLDKALAIDPKHVNSLCYKGECLRLMQKYNESIKLFNQALSIDENHIPSLQFKASCLEEQQKYKEALIYYEKLFKINPNDKWLKDRRDFCKNK
ncbi:unnamed protein product [Paramecium pentaurelia]|uniref:Tetratricopeptide repeat protein n=1 Tax=Paramecium pentaurelia TaxID=43138 RepID=A0A8S1UCG7_9CILI|nr:unnamed protein product [Paramecium pentaurelia]